MSDTLSPSSSIPHSLRDSYAPALIDSMIENVAQTRMDPTYCEIPSRYLSAQGQSEAMQEIVNNTALRNKATALVDRALNHVYSQVSEVNGTEEEMESNLSRIHSTVEIVPSDVTVDEEMQNAIKMTIHAPNINGFYFAKKYKKTLPSYDTIMSQWSQRTRYDHVGWWKETIVPSFQFTNPSTRACLLEGEDACVNSGKVVDRIASQVRDALNHAPGSAAEAYDKSEKSRLPEGQELLWAHIYDCNGIRSRWDQVDWSSCADQLTVQDGKLMSYLQDQVSSFQRQRRAQDNGGRGTPNQLKFSLTLNPYGAPSRSEPLCEAGMSTRDVVDVIGRHGITGRFTSSDGYLEGLDVPEAVYLTDFLE